MKKVLIFVASGYSTRMGGFPKALAKVGEKCVIVNAIELAAPYYDNIFVIANPTTFPAFQTELEHHTLKVSVRKIVTGKGDAESVLKSLELIESEIGMGYDATLCWGDAFFASEIPFQTMQNHETPIKEISSILVGCSVDRDPYAYFDVFTEDGNLNKMKISRSYFKKIAGSVPEGIHDQCIFRCYSSTFLECLSLYRAELGYDGENYLKSSINEMGLLNSFSFFASINKNAVIQMMPSHNVFSFNTLEELEEINQRVRV